jgi:TolA-binding protein
MSRLMAAAGLVALVATGACRDREPAPEVDTSAATVPAPATAIQEFQRTAEARLDTLDVRITALRDSLPRLKASARQAGTQALANLEADGRALRGKIRAATWDSQDAWDRFTGDVDNALADLGDRIDRALK